MATDSKYDAMVAQKQAELRGERKVQVFSASQGIEFKTGEPKRKRGRPVGSKNKPKA